MSDGSTPEFVTVPHEPTEAMLVAARDWSYAKYGKPISNDAARGCWQAMMEAAPALQVAVVPARGWGSEDDKAQKATT